ncbi:MAG TPA: response regulator [Vicinamibacterales bacterium]|nr:response regulator [Vicinamibacterales bacterium]
MTLRALIVDDEPLARRRLRTLLKAEADLDIVGECEDGVSAIAETRRLAPDVLFLDVQMPGLDGFDVIEALGPSARAAVIFVTAYDQHALRAFEVHAVDYLLKPFDRARLRQAVARVRALRVDAAELGRRLLALVGDVTANRPLDRVVVKCAAACTSSAPTRLIGSRPPDITWSCTSRARNMSFASRSKRLQSGWTPIGSSGFTDRSS